MTGQNHPDGSDSRRQGSNGSASNRGPGASGPRPSGDAPSTWDSSRDDTTIPPPHHPDGRGCGSPGGGAASPDDATVPPPGAGSGGPGVWRTPSSGSSPGGYPGSGPGLPAGAPAVPAPPKRSSRGLIVVLVALIAVLVVLLGVVAGKLVTSGNTDDASGTTSANDAAEPAVPFVDVTDPLSIPDGLTSIIQGLAYTNRDGAQDSQNAEEVNVHALQALADAAEAAEPGAAYPTSLEFDVPSQQAHYTCRHIGDERYTAWDCRTTDVVGGTPGFQVISTFNAQGLQHFKGTIGDPNWQESILNRAGRGRQ